MYPSSYFRTTYRMVKNYIKLPVPEMGISDLIFVLANAKARKNYHPLDYIVEKYGYGNLAEKLMGDPDHQPTLGTFYPFLDIRGKGPLICVVYAFRTYGNQGESNDDYLIHPPERPDGPIDRAYYFKSAIESILEIDDDMRNKYFANIKRAFLWGVNYPPHPFHPEKQFGSVHLDFALKMGWDGRIIIHPAGKEHAPRMLGAEIKPDFGSSALNPFSLTAIGPKKTPLVAIGAGTKRKQSLQNLLNDDEIECLDDPPKKPSPSSPSLLQPTGRGLGWINGPREQIATANKRGKAPTPVKSPRGRGSSVKPVKRNTSSSSSNNTAGSGTNYDTPGFSSFQDTPNSLSFSQNSQSYSQNAQPFI